MSHTNTHPHTHTHPHTQTHPHTPTHTPTPTHTHTHTHIHIYTKILQCQSLNDEKWENVNKIKQETYGYILLQHYIGLILT